MDTQTRHALKQDSFVTATSSSIGWLQAHRSSVLKVAVPAVLAIVAILAGVIFYNQRSEAALIALGKGITIYSSPVRQPGMPEQMAKDAYASYPERAKAANQQFVDTANKYGWTLSGKNAEYFAGVTFMEMTQTARPRRLSARLLIPATRTWRPLESWHSRAISPEQARHRSHRSLQAADCQAYCHCSGSDGPVGAGGMYETTRPDEAKKIYAELKDKDKTDAAGQIAAAKLAGPAAKPAR